MHSKFCFQALLTAFRKEGASAIEIAKKKRKEKEDERKRQEAVQKKRKEEEAAAAAAVAAQQSASITELTDDEATKLQQEIDGKK